MLERFHMDSLVKGVAMVIHFRDIQDEDGADRQTDADVGGLNRAEFIKAAL